MPKEKRNMHTVATATARLRRDGFDVVNVREIQSGHQLRVDAQNVVNVYSTGTTLPQGPLAGVLRETLRIVPDESIIPASEMPADPHAERFETNPDMIARLLAAMPRDPAYVPRHNPAWDERATGAPF